MRELWGRLWPNVLSLLGTTTFSILLFSIGLPIAIFLVTLAWDVYRQRKLEIAVSTLAKAFLSPQTIITLSLAVIAWGIALSWGFLKTVHQDNDKLRSIALLKAEIAQVKDTNNSLINALSERPKETLKSVVVPEVKKCWVNSTFGYGTPLVSEKSRMQRIVVFHCNYRIEAPFEVVAEFDGDFDVPQNPAAMWGLNLPGASVVSGGGREKRGREFRERIDGPSLPANEHVILTIYAAAGKEAAPQLVRANIHSVK